MALIIGLFPKVGDFRFTEVSQFDTEYSLVSGFYQFDQRPLNDSTQWWQTDKRYYIKKANTDMCTVMVQTNTIDTTPIYPDLYIEGNGVTYPLNLATFQRGAQRIVGNNYTDPVTGTSYPLDSFMWQFLFSMFIGDNAGVFRLRMRIYGDVGLTTYQDFVSDDIMVYPKWDGCTLVQATYNTNRSSEGVIVSGWDTEAIFNHRVEGQPMEYKPKANYISYLQQNYLNRQLNVNSWRTFKFRLGDIGTGVPAYKVEAISKAFEADNFWIDGKPFILDVDNSTGLQSLWDMDDPEASNLMWASTPIREKYANQNVFATETPTPDLLIIDPDSYPYALIPWYLSTGFSSVAIPASVVDDPTAQTALVAYWNTLTTEGTFYESGGSIYFNSTVGTPSIFGDFEALYTYFTAFYSGSATGGSNGFRYAGTAAKMVVDWNDGTSVDYYGNVTAATTVTHSFAATVNPSYDVRYFHNNLIPEITWNETGGGYPVVDVFVYDHSGDMPAFMTSFVVSNCSQYGLLGSNVDFTACANWILSIQIRSCINYTSAPWATISMPNLDAINLGRNGFNSTSVDAFFNDFVTNVWNGTLASGVIDIAQAPASPPAPPTAASLTSRTLLTTALWSLTTD